MKESKKIDDCIECGKEIYEGDMIYRFDNGEVIHNHCLQNYASRFEEIAEDE